MSNATNEKIINAVKEKEYVIEIFIKDEDNNLIEKISAFTVDNAIERLGSFERHELSRINL